MLAPGSAIRALLLALLSSLACRGEGRRPGGAEADAAAVVEAKRSAAGTLAHRIDLDGGAPPVAASSADTGFDAAPGPPLRLADFRPRSMLHVPAHEVPRARFPVIDFHQHVDDGFKDQGEDTSQDQDKDQDKDKDQTKDRDKTKTKETQLAYPPDKLVAMMDAINVRTLVILTGPPAGAELDRLMAALVRPHPGRFVLFTQVPWHRHEERGFVDRAVQDLRRAVAGGVRGLKVLKELGLYVRDKRGRLVAIDDARFDPIWRECGRLGIPVAIHSGDPEAFFTPTDRHNERIEELWMNPDWSFHGKDFPALPALLAARDRVIARHPRTTFVALHVGGWPENLDYVSQLLTRHRNVHVELGARQAELGRQPRRARQFFLEYQDRVLFGTDFWPEPAMYANHFRWLETADEYFPYHNHPEQGRWGIYGVELPDAVLEKIYHRNAERILGLTPR
jgi:predicted TIM-barrel fold metal-dependent hydrolase